MTGVPPPHLLGAWYIRWGIHQSKLTVYMTTHDTRRQRNLIVIANWLSQTVIMFSRSKHLTVLYRYSQLLYIDIFH